MTVFLQKLDALLSELETLGHINALALMFRIANDVLQRWIGFHEFVFRSVARSFALVTFAIESPVAQERIFPQLKWLVHIIAQIVDKYLIALFNRSDAHAISNFAYRKIAKRIKLTKTMEWLRRKCLILLLKLTHCSKVEIWRTWVIDDWENIKDVL